MKNKLLTIAVLVLVVTNILTFAGVIPSIENIPNDVFKYFPVLKVEKIYLVSQRFSLGPCNVIHYWWVDKYGRPVDLGYELKNPLNELEIVEQHLKDVGEYDPIPDRDQRYFQDNFNYKIFDA